MGRIGLSCLLCLLAFGAAVANDLDTTGIVKMDELVVVSTIKESAPLARQPLSFSVVSSDELSQRMVVSVKDLSSIVPGLHVPTYGSRQTTSVYLRGVGSRINTPSVGMYVDGVPWLDKSSFDFMLSDVARVEVLRGPQSTLYGRNTMGGLVRIFTHDPLQYSGTDVSLGAATYGDYRLSASHTRRLTESFGLSVGAHYSHRDGFFRNVARPGHKADHDDDLSLRLRTAYMPSDKWRFDFSALYEWSRQGAYPYAMLGWSSDEARLNDYFLPSLEANLGVVSQNRHSTYERHLLNLGMNASFTAERFVITNVLGFQHIQDDMFMDQDFTACDIYTLGQRQNLSVLSEELVLKNRPGAWSHWQWTSGMSVFQQWNHTDAPVTFRADGIGWLSHLINSSANEHLPIVQSGPMSMHFMFSDQLQPSDICFWGNFRTPTTSAALYHQSTITDLFNVRGLSATAGLRLDYEHNRLRYVTGYDFSHTYSLSGHLSSPFMDKDIAMVPETDFQTANALRDKLSHDYLQLLPRVSLQYEWGQSSDGKGLMAMLYGSVARGYRSGGYNIQMFSELLQAQMRADMMKDVADVTIPVLQAQPAVPADTKTQVTTLLTQMAEGGAGDASAACRFRPEYAWNYEIGTHLSFLEGRLLCNAALFLTDVRDQQISRMTGSGLGRINVNAGRSRSVGTEVDFKAKVTDALSAHLAYGFTHSTFRNYDTTDAAGNAISYRGNYVPFVPQHTLDMGATYTWTTRGWIQGVALNANWHAMGQMYWDEANLLSQKFYGTLDSRLTLRHEGIDLSLWGTNLTNQHYNAFCFESMGRTFAQRGRPLQCGVELRWHF